MENTAEIQELRNKLRMMKFPQDEILNTVRKQQKAIQKQREANDTVRAQVDDLEAQIADFDKTAEKHKTDKTLEKLIQDKKTYSNLLSQYLGDYRDEEGKRKKAEEELSLETSKAGGLFKETRANEELQARLRTMENRLDKALVRYNNNLKKLAEMRSTIEELRKDRSIFEDVMHKTKVEKEKNEEKIKKLIKTSNEAYSERDQKKMQLAELKAAETKDVKAFDEELARLNQTIEGQKIAQGHPMDQQHTIPSVNSQSGSQNDQQEELTMKTDRLNNETQKTLDLLNVANVQELFSEADKLESENFSLFNFVLEHGATRTRLQEEIAALELQLKSIMGKTEKTDEEQSEELKQLTDVIQRTDDELTGIKAKRAKDEEEFASVYTEVEAIFNALECSWDNAPDGKSTITPVNAMFCLSEIESTVRDMMTTVFDRTRIQCGRDDVKPSSFVQEHTSVGVTGANPAKHVQTRQAQEKELSSKVADTSKPLSIEDMMAMLD